MVRFRLFTTIRRCYASVLLEQSFSCNSPGSHERLRSSSYAGLKAPLSVTWIALLTGQEHFQFFFSVLSSGPALITCESNLSAFDRLSAMIPVHSSCYNTGCMVPLWTSWILTSVSECYAMAAD